MDRHMIVYERILWLGIFQSSSMELGRLVLEFMGIEVIMWLRLGWILSMGFIASIKGIIREIGCYCIPLLIGSIFILL